MILFLQATMQGLALGAVYSLVAIGLVLIYKATDVLSFAQPALAVAGAGIISALAVDRGISFWIALPLAIFITGVIGLIIERTFLRAMVGEPVFSVASLNAPKILSLSCLRFLNTTCYWLLLTVMLIF